MQSRHRDNDNGEIDDDNNGVGDWDVKDFAGTVPFAYCFFINRKITNNTKSPEGFFLNEYARIMNVEILSNIYGVVLFATHICSSPRHWGPVGNNIYLW